MPPETARSFIPEEESKDTKRDVREPKASPSKNKFTMLDHMGNKAAAFVKNKSLEMQKVAPDEDRDNTPREEDHKLIPNSQV